MSKRDDLIKQCRYYHGEEENPYTDGNKALFWDYEMKWVALYLTEDERLSDCCNEYVSHGLMEFEEKDGVPFTLKALLYNRFQQWLEGTPSEFKKFYKEQYLGQI